MPKGSPKKGSDKGSPGSKKDKSSKKSPTKKKSPTNVVNEIPPIQLKNVRRKLVWTYEGWPDYEFYEYRCPVCRLALCTFLQFLSHHCWRKYYQARFHLGETQAFACRTCNQVFYSHADYASHVCNDHKLCYERKYREVEEVLPITYPDHFNFYISWARRLDWETRSHDPDWYYTVRCGKCSNKFTTKIKYLLHSCFQFALLPPVMIRRLKTCIYCHYIFLDEKQYNEHLPYCSEERAFCVDFAISLTELACQQFVLGRHCYEFDYHLHHGAAFKQRQLGEPPGGSPQPPEILPKGPSISVNCFACGYVQPNLEEYFYHPCVAGKLITPADLELILFCTDCQCLFTNLEELVEHGKSCSSLVFTFVRLNTPELVTLALKRWTIDVMSNPYLPARQIKFLCGVCKELFRWFEQFLGHACPRKERYERIFLQPSALLETYTCHACHLVLFSISEAVSHSSHCPSGRTPKMIQVHYTMSEILLALSPWMRGPQLLQFDINIGLGNIDEELAYRLEETRIKDGKPKYDCEEKIHNKYQASKRLANWLNEREEKQKYLESQILNENNHDNNTMSKFKIGSAYQDSFDDHNMRLPVINKFSSKTLNSSQSLKASSSTLRGVHWNQKVC